MSLFSNLYKYRQKENKNEKENFLTELFAYVLQNDIDFRCDFFEKVIKIIDFDKKLEITVSTQENYPIKNKKSARPDIVIKGFDFDKKLKFVVFIENKIDSSLGYRIFENQETKEDLWLNQLSIYDNVLVKKYAEKIGKNKLHLVYLTKYFEAFEVNFISKFIHITWHEIFHKALNKVTEDHTTIKSQFKQFLIDLQMNKDNKLDLSDVLAYHTFYVQTLGKLTSILDYSKSEVKKIYGYNFGTVTIKNFGGIFIKSEIGKLSLRIGFYKGVDMPPFIFCICETNNKNYFEAIKKPFLQKENWGIFDDRLMVQKALFLTDILSNVKEEQNVQILNFFQSAIDELREDEEFMKLSK